MFGCRPCVLQTGNAWFLTNLFLIFGCMKGKEEGRLRGDSLLQNSHGNSCWRNTRGWSSARGQMRTRMNRKHISTSSPFIPLCQSTAVFLFFKHPFIQAHSLHMFTAERFNPFLLIISCFYVHTYTCLFSTHSEINLCSQAHPLIFSAEINTQHYYISQALRFKSCTPLKSFSSHPFHRNKPEI